MRSDYKGMRWLKCDLQMQTPADAQHWAGVAMIPGQEAAAAEAFAAACYEKRLDVVGITDHNFLSKDFIPHLLSAFKSIKNKYNHEITLFPGFEFEAAGVGRGVHVLCLFEPGADLNLIDSILTRCGVKYPRLSNGRLEKSDRNLKDILNIVQVENIGVVIMPHSTSNDGIFDDNSISEWLQQDQFTNPNLLAVEVPKPVHLMSQGYQKLLNSSSDCDPGWRRIRPIATVMSSDNKTLIDEDLNGKPKPNSIGYRYSWIKMSSPSIESLRQAFLDHESRIILPDNIAADNHPSNRFNHSAILSVTIKNVAFLNDKKVFFSPNMNCLIGGRGSGKSTLIEYLRIIFCQDELIEQDDGTKTRIQRIKDTLNAPAAELEVLWRGENGIEETIAWSQGKSEVRDRNLIDPETYFKSLPLKFYSQQQLNRLTESRADESGLRQAQRLLDLIDGFDQRKLDDLLARERALMLKIDDCFSNIQRSELRVKDLKRLQQENQDLNRQWKARSEIQEDARRHQMLKEEWRYVDEVNGTLISQIANLAGTAESLNAVPNAAPLPEWPHYEQLKKVDVNVRLARERLANKLREALLEFQIAVEGLRTGENELVTIDHELASADADFRIACEAKGLTPNDVGRLHEISESIIGKQKEIEEIEAKVKYFRDSAGDPNTLFHELHNLWREQFSTRLDSVNYANSLANPNQGNAPFIEVTAYYQQDRNDFMRIWREFRPADGRTRVGRNWDDIGDCLYKSFVNNSVAESPWVLFETQLNKKPDEIFHLMATDLKQHIAENPEEWQKLRCSRVRDMVDLKLFRMDGSTAGSISAGTLSDGQRNTAALALLLAQDGGPLVIDQPEDELDSNFVFRELIPMLRKVKTKRQIIMATHNANLPVNGDAELVCALEARNGKGEVLATGGLDKAAVTKAVLDIMEGSEDAFRMRREKYHF